MCGLINKVDYIRKLTLLEAVVRYTWDKEQYSALNKP